MASTKNERQLQEGMRAHQSGQYADTEKFNPAIFIAPGIVISEQRT